MIQNILQNPDPNSCKDPKIPPWCHRWPGYHSFVFSLQQQSLFLRGHICRVFPLLWEIPAAPANKQKSVLKWKPDHQTKPDWLPQSHDISVHFYIFMEQNRFILQKLFNSSCSKLATSSVLCGYLWNTLAVILLMDIKHASGARKIPPGTNWAIKNDAQITAKSNTDQWILNTAMNAHFLKVCFVVSV